MNDQGQKIEVRREEEASRDYVAIGVFVAGLVALIVAGYFSLVTLMKGDISNPLDALSGWVQGLEEHGKGLLGEATRGLRPQKDHAQQARDRVSAGYRLYSKNQLNDALGEYEKAIGLDPGNPEAYYWRGRTHIKGGQYDLALDDFLRAVKLKPDYTEAYDNLGWLFWRQKQYDKAISHLSRSIELKQNNAWAYHHRGRIYYEKGERERALDDLKKACDMGHQESCNLYHIYKDKGKTTKGKADQEG
jgi:tetratricopeptide (TPR) repeat protein